MNLVSTQPLGQPGCCSTFAGTYNIHSINNKEKMTSIKARLNLIHSDRAGRYPLVLQIIRNRVKRELPTPFRLSLEEFDKQSETARNAGRSRERVLFIRQVNEYLVAIKTELNEIRDSFESQSNSYGAQDIVQTFRHRNDLSCLFVYADALVLRMKKENRIGTASNYRSAVNAFAKFVDNPHFSFHDLTVEIVGEFAACLKSDGCRPNTISFYIRHLRALYNKVVDDGILLDQNRPFRKINLKEEQTAKRAISNAQVSLIAQLDLSDRHEHLSLAQDLFLFSFYTCGMAFVDMCQLTKGNIHGETLVYRRQKTDQELTIHIEPPLRALIKKYACADTSYLLPMLCQCVGGDTYKWYRYMQSRLNKRIREIGVLLKFDFPLTFYVARHTWATLAQDMGIPMSIISNSMGHTQESTTHIYLSHIDQRKQDKANRMVLQSCIGK